MENADFVSVSTDSGSLQNTDGNADDEADNNDFSDADNDGTIDDLEAVGEYGVIDGLSVGDKITVTATLEGKTQVIQTYTVKDN
jgi:hypothetical protein